ncbi:uncharacterized protein [Centruroides vittatus]|uniref:uncharacterized protein n=1 Tax=Centruroides vittatus TaxID=120091 RepID=UPI00350F7C32
MAYLDNVNSGIPAVRDGSCDFKYYDWIDSHPAWMIMDPHRLYTREEEKCNIGVIIDFEAFTIKDMGLAFDTLCRQVGYVAHNWNEFGKIDFYNENIIFDWLNYSNKINVRFGNHLHGLYLAYEEGPFGEWEKSENVCRILYDLFLKYKIFYYKGGEIEKNFLDLTSEIYNVYIPYFDLEDFGVPKSSDIRVPCPNHLKKYPHNCPPPKKRTKETVCNIHRMGYPHECRRPQDGAALLNICTDLTRFIAHCPLCNVFSYKTYMFKHNIWQYPHL